MKKNKLIGILLFLVMSVFLNGGEATVGNSSNYDIPDNNSVGVTSNIYVDTGDIPSGATIESLRYAIDIKHTYVGDLKVTLTSPSGRTVVIWNNEGGSDDNIYKGNTITNFNGESPHGTWKVKVVDSAGGDTGYIDIVALQITYSEPVTKPTISSFNVVENGSGNGAVKVTFNVSSSASLTRVRAHCSTSSSVSTSSSYYYEWKDGTTSTGAKTIYLNNSNWAGDRVYCKAEVEAGSGNKADFTIDSVQLASPAPTISSVSPTTAIVGEYKNFTVYGSNLPTTLVGNINGSTTNCSYVSSSGSSVTLNCRADVAGHQRFYLKESSGPEVEVISGSASIYIDVSDVTIEDTPILDLLNNDGLIQNMNLSSNLDNQLSRSDAIVMIDRMRVLVKSGAEKNMEEYYNPFADVPGDAEYLPSLARLAYYRSVSFDVNPINKYNDLFNPMRHMSREEFVKVAMASFDIPKQMYDLSVFDDFTYGDFTNISDWAVEYFETAVHYGIINGNNGRILARDRISIQEALWILERIRAEFESNYPFDISSYDSP